VVGVTLDDKQFTIRKIAAAGADIVQLNCVRQQLSRLKNGGLARAARPATVVALIFSDILTNDLRYVASGPTASGGSTRASAWHVVEQLHLQMHVPDNVRQLLTSTTEHDDVDEWHAHNILIGDNRTAIRAAAECMRASGTLTVSGRNDVTGDAAEVSARTHDEHVVDWPAVCATHRC
jgi:hydroxypyruvate reductase